MSTLVFILNFYYSIFFYFKFIYIVFEQAGSARAQAVSKAAEKTAGKAAEKAAEKAAGKRSGMVLEVDIGLLPQYF